MAGLPRVALLRLPAQPADPRTPVSWSLKQPLAGPDWLGQLNWCFNPDLFNSTARLPGLKRALLSKGQAGCFKQSLSSFQGQSFMCGAGDSERPGLLCGLGRGWGASSTRQTSLIRLRESYFSSTNLSHPTSKMESDKP